MYNEKLEKLCKEYKISYVDTRVLENTIYNNVILNYISKYPPYIVACEIIKKMYERIQSDEKDEQIVVEKPTVVNDGALGIIGELQKDIDRASAKAKDSQGYERDVWEEKILEHTREKEVFEKVYKKSKMTN